MQDAILAPKTFYVYTYAYPNGTIFYVGKGTNGRIDEHEREARNSCPCRKCSVIRSIWASGKPVQKRIVYETFDEQEALEREQTLIRSHTGPDLTNIKDNLYRVKNQQSGRGISASQPIGDRVLLSTAEAVKISGLSRIQIQRLLKTKQIDGMKPGHDWFVFEDSLAVYMAQPRKPGPKPKS